MKTRIEVADRKEGDLIRRGLTAPDVRAFVKVMGALKMLPTDRARFRVMHFVKDYFAETYVEYKKDGDGDSSL